jgi:colicin import membrane protein
MAEHPPSPTISVRERTFALVGAEDQLPKWLTVSLALHAVLISLMFAMSFIPSSAPPAPPVYVVDLLGGERIGRTNLGSELTAVPKQTVKRSEPEAVAAPESKKEIPEKTKVAEKKTPVEEEVPAAKEKPTKQKSAPESTKTVKNESQPEPSVDSVRERLIQAAAERAKSRPEQAPKPAKAEVFSAGSGEGDGAASLGVGGRGGAGVLKGMEFVIYQNRMLSTIKDNWAWVGQRTNLRVVVQFGIKENGEITGLKVLQPSGDVTYDESVLRAVKKSSPLPAPPSAYRKDFAEVELTFRPRDLGA